MESVVHICGQRILSASCMRSTSANSGSHVFLQNDLISIPVATKRLPRVSSFSCKHFFVSPPYPSLRLHRRKVHQQTSALGFFDYSCSQIPLADRVARGLSLKNSPLTFLSPVSCLQYQANCQTSREPFCANSDLSRVVTRGGG